MPSIEHLGRVRAAASEARIDLLQDVLLEDASGHAQQESKLASAISAMQQAISAYEPLISDSEERSLYEKFRADWDQYRALEPEALRLVREQKTAEALALVQGRMGEHYTEASDTLDALVRLNAEAGQASAAHGDDVFAVAWSWGLASLTAVIVLSIVAAWRFARGIATRLEAIAREAEGMAHGDLHRSLTVQGRDEVAMLQEALLSMQSRLRDIVQGVRQNADSVATASAEIAQGNADLSHRTEEQASALQQTAASMEQLGATVKQNAENARLGNQLAQSASDIARDGGNVVKQVIATMKGIESSSTKISEIISVIDSIAFQTNILALNAAVEAARAGEQGRGFAVVAGEVRTLAHRSANAAKEIKTLIVDSVERSKQGTLLVDQAGETMNQVVASIRRVTDIMGEISTASAEQSAGVSQASEAVSHMDQTTQQNAALVEQSAAAAESLRNQAQELVAAVAVFGGSAQTPRADAGGSTREPVAPGASATRTKASAATEQKRGGGLLAVSRSENEWATF